MTIDTIHIDLPPNQIPNISNWKDLVNGETGEIISSRGDLEEIIVYRNALRVRIQCSLPKLLKGNNIYNLTYDETIAAFTKIENLLGISLKDGIVRRIDFFVNIETNFVPQTYFKYLSDSRYYIRTLVGKTSLYYKNGNREIIFYDKIQEIKKNKRYNGEDEVPSAFIGKNILRLECKYKNAFLKNMFKKSLKVKDIYSRDFFSLLNERIYLEYICISKINRFTFDMSKIKTTTDLKTQLTRIGIEKLGGVNSVLEMIDAERGSPHITHKKYFSNWKSEVKELGRIKNHTFNSNFADELTHKIENYINDYEAHHRE